MEEIVVQHFTENFSAQRNRSPSSRMAHYTGLRPLIALAACIMSSQATAVCTTTTSTGIGVRLLVSLQSGVHVEPGSGDGSVDNPWKLTQ